MDTFTLASTLKATLGESPILVPLILVLASSFLLSLGHCVGMCGGIVLAYSSIKKATALSHIVYSVGRLCSYVGIGVAFALLGRAFSLHHMWREFASVAVGIVLVVYAFAFAFFPKLVRLLEPSVQKFPLFTRFFSQTLRAQTLLSFFILGVLNGLLPCGLVYFFALYTLNEQALGLSGISGAMVVMMVFWLGTLPSMLSVGALGSLLVAYKKQFMWLSFVSMLLLGLWNIYIGITTIAH